MYKLDFLIQDAQKRAELVQSFDLSDAKPKDLELIADYLCFGKDPDGVSPVDRHEIQIETRYSHFQQKKVQSLDALFESPTFNEASLRPLRGGTNYRKPTSRNIPLNIPNIAEIQSDIEELQNHLSTLDPSSKEYYVIRHEIINLRQKRYQIRDEWYGTIAAKNVCITEQPSTEEICVLPNGVMCSPNDKMFGKRKLCDSPLKFNFENTQHIAELVKWRQDLEGANEEKELLWTLDYYVKRANLKPKLQIVLEGRIAHQNSQVIAKRIQEELGVSHSYCYMSMLWKIVLREIVRSVKLVRDEIALQDNEDAWRVCRCCGQKKLKDKRCFVSKGERLSRICKECDRKKRAEEAASQNQ